MERNIMQNLVTWKDNPRRKPLILTGVRQCGKTYILKEFGKRYFSDICYINFEASKKYSSIFAFDFDTKRIIQEIEILKDKKMVAEKTLETLINS